MTYVNIITKVTLNFILSYSIDLFSSSFELVCAFKDLDLT